MGSEDIKCPYRPGPGSFPAFPRMSLALGKELHVILHIFGPKEKIPRPRPRLLLALPTIILDV